MSGFLAPPLLPSAAAIMVGRREHGRTEETHTPEPGQAAELGGGGGGERPHAHEREEGEAGGDAAGGRAGRLGHSRVGDGDEEEEEAEEAGRVQPARRTQPAERVAHTPRLAGANAAAGERAARRLDEESAGEQGHDLREGAQRERACVARLVVRRGAAQSLEHADAPFTDY